jgi:hypothetical protein
MWKALLRAGEQVGRGRVERLMRANGAYPGYYAYNFTSTDGQRQAVIEVNADPTSVPKTTLLKSISLLAKGVLRRRVTQSSWGRPGAE